MISRSARRLEDPNARTPEQGTPRKFGNIANRLEKSVHTFPSKKMEVRNMGVYKIKHRCQVIHKIKGILTTTKKPTK
jgi:hypothetical protein